MAIEIFAEVAGIDRTDAAQNQLYRDVPSTLNHAAAINEATRLCWIEGYTKPHGDKEGVFKPTSTLNRAEAAKILSVILARKAK